MHGFPDPYDEYFIGPWRITATEMWDKHALDLLDPACISFGGHRLGNMKFIAASLDLDYRTGLVGGSPIVEFTFSGEDDRQPTCGRGWARIEREELHGRIYFHCGDESWFVAVRDGAEQEPSSQTRRRRES